MTKHDLILLDIVAVLFKPALMVEAFHLFL